jgi:uncharacterized protein (UPF0276 family)
MQSMTPSVQTWISHAGVGLKPQHVAEILSGAPSLGFFEVHGENYMGAGGTPHRHLEAIREVYPLSIHGVGLSLGGAGDLDADHLARLVALVERYEPALVSEHLAWSMHEAGFLNDLLPLPYTVESLQRVCEHVDHVQSVLARQILVENPSTYLAFAESTFDEVGFITEVAKRTGCGLLLDVNNVHVRCANHRESAEAYLAAFPLRHVGEIHLAGHASHTGSDGQPLFIDSHDRPVCEAVWALYRGVIDRMGPVPTLVERDAAVPAWAVLRDEALRGHGYMKAAAGGGDLAIAC